MGAGETLRQTVTFQISAHSLPQLPEPSSPVSCSLPLFILRIVFGEGLVAQGWDIPADSPLRNTDPDFIAPLQ